MNAVFSVYDLLTGKIVSKLSGHKSCTRDVSWHPYQNTIVTTSVSTKLSVYNVIILIHTQTKNKEIKTSMYFGIKVIVPSAWTSLTSSVFQFIQSSLKLIRYDMHLFQIYIVKMQWMHEF